MGVGEGLLTWPYPLKVQACPPRDQRRALRSKVSGQIAQWVAVWGWGVGGGVLTWPYPLNVQSCPP